MTTYTDEQVEAIMRVAFKAGVQSGFDWPKLALAEVHKQQLYENWAQAQSDQGQKEDAEDCRCREGAETLCVNILCPRRDRG